MLRRHEDASKVSSSRDSARAIFHLTIISGLRIQNAYLLQHAPVHVVLVCGAGLLATLRHLTHLLLIATESLLCCDAPGW